MKKQKKKGWNTVQARNIGTWTNENSFAEIYVWPYQVYDAKFQFLEKALLETIGNRRNIKRLVKIIPQGINNLQQMHFKLFQKKQFKEQWRA